VRSIRTPTFQRNNTIALKSPGELIGLSTPEGLIPTLRGSGSPDVQGPGDQVCSSVSLAFSCALLPRFDRKRGARLLSQGPPAVPVTVTD
jgi:hypothetical protein